MTRCDTGDGKAPMPFRRYPCGPCPIRADNADNPDSQFPAERWRALEESVCEPGTGFGAGFDAPLFGCHKRDPATGEDLACAGWLAVFGTGHPRVRLAVASGRLPASALAAGKNWPRLHRSWDEVVTHHTSDDRVP